LSEQDSHTYGGECDAFREQDKRKKEEEEKRKREKE
jgi:hypothetical protein